MRILADISVEISLCLSGLIRRSWKVLRKVKGNLAGPMVAVLASGLM